MAQDILHEIADHNRVLVERAKAVRSERELFHAADDVVYMELERMIGFSFPFRRAVAAPGLSIIAEVKRASPSKGLIVEDFEPLAIARDYEYAGASAVSVLTEPKWFQGSLTYLTSIAETVHIPVLRKDFIVDSYQIYESKVWGANAILLIVALLSDDELVRFRTIAERFGMDVLVEAYTEEELERAVASGAEIIGVNNRNLRDFAVDFERAERMRAMVPSGCLYVAESGVSSLDDVRTIARMGADAALVGEYLMRAENRAGLLAQMRKVANEQ